MGRVSLLLIENNIDAIYLIVMIPCCRTLEEADRVLAVKQDVANVEKKAG